nr:hypothetical protein [uncultured Oscillibacter sp.]
MAKRRLGASFSARTALIGLEIRQDSRVQSPCLAKKSAPIQHSANFQTRPSRIETGLRVVADFEIPFFADALDVSPLWLLEREDNK